MTKKLTLLAFTILGLSGLIFTKDLKQKNTPTLFLTSQGLTEYVQFKKDFHEKSVLIIKKDYSKKITQADIQEFTKQKNILDQFCNEHCTVFQTHAEKLNIGQLFELKDGPFLGLIIIGQNDHILKDLINYTKTLKFWSTNPTQIHFAGEPYTNLLLDHYSQKIKKVLFPTLFIGIFIFLTLLTKNLIHGFFLFFPCLMAASLSLVFIKLTQGQTNLITSIIPLMMFIVNLSISLHLYYTSIELGDMKLAIKDKFRPLLMMVLTTFIGFFSLYFTQLQIIRTFGLLTGPLILLTALATILWFYICSIFIKPNYCINIPTFLSYFEHSLDFKKIYTITLIAMFGGSLAVSHIKIITDATLYFPKSSKFKESIDSVAHDLLGPPVVEIIIDLDQSSSRNTIEQLKKIEVLEQKIQSSTSFKILSRNQMIRTINQTYAHKKFIPDYLVSYSTLGTKIPPLLEHSYPYGKRYRITLMGLQRNVDMYENTIFDLQKLISESKIYNFTFNGLHHHLMLAQKKMISTLFQSFLLTLFIISLMAYIFYKETNIFIFFLVVNIVPVFASFILLLLFQLSFNIATVMTYSISLGLIVDSSFHIIHALKKETLTRQYYRNCIIWPILMTSLPLFISFALFSLNDFLPIREFGLCLAVIIILGTFFDLKILPGLFLNRTNVH